MVCPPEFYFRLCERGWPEGTEGKHKTVGFWLSAPDHFFSCYRTPNHFKPVAPLTLTTMTRFPIIRGVGPQTVANLFVSSMAAHKRT